MTKEIHSASRVILATPRGIFRAHIDPEVLVKWRAPAGMTAHLTEFHARPGGGYRMELRYTDGAGRGKSTADSDIVRVRFVDLAPDDLIVEAATFESDDPATRGVMTITTRLTPVSDGTKVVVTAQDVPPAISAEDHRLGMESSLRHLALLLERKRSAKRATPTVTPARRRPGLIPRPRRRKEVPLCGRAALTLECFYPADGATRHALRR